MVSKKLYLFSVSPESLVVILQMTLATYEVESIQSTKIVAPSTRFYIKPQLPIRGAFLWQDHRSIRLPDTGDTSKAFATYVDGLLKLDFPRREPPSAGRLQILVGDGAGATSS